MPPGSRGSSEPSESVFSIISSGKLSGIRAKVLANVPKILNIPFVVNFIRG